MIRSTSAIYTKTVGGRGDNAVLAISLTLHHEDPGSFPDHALLTKHRYYLDTAVIHVMDFNRPRTVKDLVS